MRKFWVGLALTVAVLLPTVGNAQVFQFRTPPPDISAAGAEWQINSDPIVVGGLTYYPTRGFRLFDGQIMAQTGMFENVPVYADTTLEPYTEIYVPLGSGRMRVYERRRDRERAGTTGSYVPMVATEQSDRPQPSERPAGTSGVTAAGGRAFSRDTNTAVNPEPARPRRRSIVTNIPHEADTNNSVWLEFRGTRWYSSGPAAVFSPDRFERIDNYRGFPVYRDKAGDRGEIWVSVVKDGPVAPYARR